MSFGGVGHSTEYWDPTFSSMRRVSGGLANHVRTVTPQTPDSPSSYVYTRSATPTNQSYTRSMTPTNQAYSVYSRTVTPPPVYSRAVTPPPVYSRAVTPPPVYSRTVTPPPVYSRTVTPPRVYSRTVTPPPVYSRTVTPPPVYSRTVTPPPVYKTTVVAPPPVYQTTVVAPHRDSESMTSHFQAPTVYPFVNDMDEGMLTTYEPIKYVDHNEDEATLRMSTEHSSFVSTDYTTDGAECQKLSSVPARIHQRSATPTRVVVSNTVTPRRILFTTSGEPQVLSGGVEVSGYTNYSSMS